MGERTLQEYRKCWKRNTRNHCSNANGSLLAFSEDIGNENAEVRLYLCHLMTLSPWLRGGQCVRYCPKKESPLRLASQAGGSPTACRSANSKLTSTGASPEWQRNLCGRFSNYWDSGKLIKNRMGGEWFVSECSRDFPSAGLRGKSCACRWSEWELSPPQAWSKGDGIRVLGSIVEEQREPRELPSQPMCPSSTLTIQKKQTKHWRGSMAGAQHKPRFY